MTTYTDTGLRIGDLKLFKGYPAVTASLSRALLRGEAEELKRRGLQAIEFRVDKVEGVHEKENWPKLREMVNSFRPFPVILTPRIDHEGGGWGHKAPIGLRRELYETLAPYVDAFDVERLYGDMEFVLKLGHEQGKLVIVSAHYFEPQRLEHLLSLVDRAVVEGAEVVKVAVMLECKEELAVLRQVLTQRPNLNLIVIPMGEHGRQGRLTFGHDGSLITFVALTPETASAPGQWLIDEFVEAMKIEYPDFRLPGSY